MSERIVCPYRGLTPYAEEDAPFFFGRAEDTQLIVANLFSARVTVLFGPSGVGKSSILRAGAIRDLRRRQTEAVQRGERPDLLIIYFRTWQGDAMAALRQSIVTEAEKLLGRPVNAPAGGTLAELLQHITNELDADVMLMLDQFEEYFRYETHFGEPGSFAVEFAEAVGRAGLPVSFLLSLREDSLAELDRFKTLVPNLFTNWYRLDRLGMEAAARAVSGPVEEYNKLPEADRQFSGTIELEAGLAGEVLQQVRKGAVVIGDVGRGTARQNESGIETPYLQLVLTQLWEEELTSGSKKLRVETLRRLGGAAEIVRRHVETVLGKLTRSERQMCARMFDYLVTDSGAKIAYRAADLANKAGVDESLMKSLLGKLADGDKRILTTVAPAPDRPTEPQYEIYHDSLSRAVIAWRRRFVENGRQRKMLLTVGVAALLLLGAVMTFGYISTNQLELEKERLKSAALQAEAAKLKTQVELSQAEVNLTASKLARALDRKVADPKEIAELQNKLKLQFTEAQKYAALANNIGKSKYEVVPKEEAQREINDWKARFEKSERERERLDKERRELEQQLSGKNAAQSEPPYLSPMQSPPPQQQQQQPQYPPPNAARPAPSIPRPAMVRRIFVINRAEALQLKSGGDPDWFFKLKFKTASGFDTGEGLRRDLDLRFEKRGNYGTVYFEYGVEVEALNPVLLVEITARNGRNGAPGPPAILRLDSDKPVNVRIASPDAQAAQFQFSVRLSNAPTAR